MDAVRIGQRLYALRGNKPRAVVATAVGVSLSALTMYENGERIPRDEIKVRLSKYYNVSIGDLFFAD